jgi:hypothetical protein
MVTLRDALKVVLMVSRFRVTEHLLQFLCLHNGANALYSRYRQDNG